MREWLNAQAAGGYVEYDPASGRYTLPPEQTVALTDSDSPAYLPGFFQIALGSVLDSPRITEAARSGEGVGWHEHSHDVFEGCERFFRPGYNANLVPSWLPALDGVVEKLERGANVADVGCGHGSSTILMAKAFPNSTFVGSDYHEGSIETARKRAREAGVDSVRFEVAPAAAYSGTGYDLVTMFDCLHDMGDPAGAARHVRETLAPDGTWMIVEPQAGDRVEDNLNPVGRAYYGFSTLLCTPASLSQEVGLALGAQAGEARHPRRRLGGGSHPLPPRGRDALQPRLRGAALTVAIDRVGSEQTRARYPESEGYVERDGVRVHYEVFGSGEPTILLLPTWSIVHSRVWKMQVPYLARHCRVVTFDPRGNGQLRPAGGCRGLRRRGVRRRRAGRARRDRHRAVGARRALDGRAARAAACGRPPGARRGRRLHRAGRAARGADAARAGGARSTRSSTPTRAGRSSTATTGGATTGTSSSSSSRQMFTEPHSTKQIEDCVGWGLETTRRRWSRRCRHAASTTPRGGARALPRGPLPGARDPRRRRTASGRTRSGEELARVTGGALVTLEGSGHGPQARDPVKVNLLLRDFTAPAAPAAGLDARAHQRPHPRALRLVADRARPRPARPRDRARAARAAPGPRDRLARAAPGHARCSRRAARRSTPRARCSRTSRATSSPSPRSTTCTASRPGGGWTRSCSRTSWSSTTSCATSRYDLWIGDEAWELDYYLHENPELKTAAYAWLTDFVGWLPMPDGGEREAFLTADYNAEMIEHVARYPRVRDRAIFVGDADDIVPDAFGPGLPRIRDWTEQHFDFAGYVTGFDPAELADRERLRAELGYRADEQVCIVTVGGSGVGGAPAAPGHRRVPEAKRACPGCG